MEWPSLLGNDKLKLLKHLPEKLSDCHPAESTNTMEGMSQNNYIKLAIY